MNLSKKLISAVAGSFFLSLAYSLSAKSDGLSDIKTDEEVIRLALATRALISSSGVDNWVNENDGIKGSVLSWDLNGDRIYDLMLFYEYFPGSRMDLGNYFFGISRRYPSEIFFNRVDPEHFDTTKGDIYLKISPEGNYQRTRYVESEKKT